MERNLKFPLCYEENGHLSSERRELCEPFGSALRYALPVGRVTGGCYFSS